MYGWFRPGDSNARPELILFEAYLHAIHKICLHKLPLFLVDFFWRSNDMRQKLLKIGKTTGRILILITIVLVLLLVGFLLRGFVPTAWLQSLQIGSVTLPAWIVQSRLPAVSPTSPPDIVGGIRDEVDPSPTPEFTTTPTFSSRTSSGIVTVITLTPTPAFQAANGTPTNTLVVEPVPEETATPTLLPSITAQPLNTQATAEIAPTTVSEVSPEMTDIRTDLQNLAQVIESTRIMVQAIRQGQPTDEEMITVRMQLNVLDQRMKKLAGKMQAVITPGSESNVLPEQAPTMITMMQEAVKMLQNIMASPDVNSTQLEQSQSLLDKLYGIIDQLQSLVAPTARDGQPVTSLATPTPTMTASPTATDLPVNTPTSLTRTDAQYSQLQAILDEMEELLRQMEAILQPAP
jgi:hypothetical protein